jgi:hypothetical protein
MATMEERAAANAQREVEAQAAFMAAVHALEPSFDPTAPNGEIQDLLLSHGLDRLRIDPYLATRVEPPPRPPPPESELSPTAPQDP